MLNMLHKCRSADNVAHTKNLEAFARTLQMDKLVKREQACTLHHVKGDCSLSIIDKLFIVPNF